jgi:hypothetical protein
MDHRRRNAAALAGATASGTSGQRSKKPNPTADATVVQASAAWQAGVPTVLILAVQLWRVAYPHDALPAWAQRWLSRAWRTTRASS